MDFGDVLIAGLGPDQLRAEWEVPARPESRMPWPNWVNPQVLDALTSLGIAEAWSHQAEAASALHDGRSVVLATGTGSGKSLAAWVPFLSASVSEKRSERISLADVHRRPTALYVSPTKALAADQVASVQNVIAAGSLPVAIAAVDGDAEREIRQWARAHADIVATNPDFAHAALMGGHERWARFWRGLNLIIIDEFHSYRGLFGGNVALVVRRMMRIAEHYGARPVVAFLSATSSDPLAAAQRFLGPAAADVVAVTEDGSPRGRNRILVVEPKLHDLGHAVHAVQEEVESHDDLVGAEPDDADPPARRSVLTEAAAITTTLVTAGARSLTFCRSRQGVERVADQIRSNLDAIHSPLRDHVGAYRGGYLPEERRELEERLRTGDIRNLATTSALELGIDVSGLDAVVSAGWPGTLASFRQQVGRAGRAGSAGLGVLLIREDPLDHYLAANPQELVTPTHDQNVFDPANPYLLHPHLCSAAAEFPLSEADCECFGLATTDTFDDLAEAGLLRRRGDEWWWNVALGVDAHSLVDIRGSAGTVNIVDTESGALLGTVDQARADSTVYPGAVYVHQGAPFMVDSLEDDTALVHPHREDDIWTFAVDRSTVEITSVTDAVDLGNLGMWAHGDVTVTSQVVAYDVRRKRDGLFLGRVPLEMPNRSLETHGTWWTLSPAVLNRAGLTPDILPGALHAAEHASIGLLPAFATCDRWDIGGLSTARHPDTGEATVIVHDSVPGGSGFSTRGFEAGRQWIAATHQLIESCPCARGCPRCIQSPKCGNGNEPLSKTGALLALTALLQLMDSTNPGQP